LQHRAFPIPISLILALCAIRGLEVTAVQEAVSQRQVPQERQRHVNVRSVVDLSRSELITVYPELKNKLEFVEDQKDLAFLLQKVGENVEAFFNSFPNTTSLEEVRQELLRADGEVVRSRRTKYNYLMVTLPQGETGLEESRTDLKGSPVNLSGFERGFLLTYGYASREIYFHPQYQSGSRFRYLGQAPSRYPDYPDRAYIPGAHVIAFAQRPEEAKILDYFRIPGHNVEILVQGLVWIYSHNYQIARMRTDLLAPTDMGLESQMTQIEFGEVHLGTPPRAFWLPYEVVVKLRFNQALYRNRHRYSDYKLFSVESFEKRNPPKP